MKNLGLAKPLATGLIAFVCACAIWQIFVAAFVFREPNLKPAPGGGGIHPSGRYVNSKEGYSRTSYQVPGIRGRFPPLETPVRVLAVGDSYTEAFQVSDEETFCSVAERTLREEGIEAGFYNGGISGGDPAMYVGMSGFFKNLVHPSQVVVQLDQGDFDSDLDRRSGLFYIYPSKGSFELRSSALRVDSIHNFMSRYLSLGILAAMKFQTASEEAPNEQVKSPVAKSRLEEKWRRYVEWSVENLKRCYDDPILVYMPTMDYYSIFEPAHPVEDLLEMTCRRQGVTFINMRPAIIEEFRRSHQPANGFSNTSPGLGHINALGHRLVGERLARIIKARLQGATALAGRLGESP